MRSVNKVIIIGNLTRDPETRQTPNGQTVVTFGIATNREWATRDGRKQNLTEYHDLVAWANLAEICGKYLRKSKLVYIEGYLKTRSWETPEGIKKFKTEIVVQDMIMLDKRTSEGDENYIPQEEGSMGTGNGEQSESRMSPSPSREIINKRVETTPVETTKNPPAETVVHFEPSTPAKIDIDQDLGL